MLLANPNTVSADGVTTTALTVAVLDALGAPVPAAPVSFTVSGTHNVLSDDTGLTAPDGTLTVTLASSQPEIKDIVAFVDDLALTTQVAFTLTAPSQLNSALVANPNMLPAGNTTLLTLSLADATGSAIDNANVSWSATGQDIELSDVTGITDGTGYAQTTLRSQIATRKLVTATVGGTGISTPVVFQPLAPSELTVAAASGSAPADGAHGISVTATVADSFNNGIPGQAVTFTGATGTVFTPDHGVTDDRGVFTSQATSTLAGPQHANATAGPLFGSASITFVAGQVVAGRSSLTVSPSTLTADGQSTASLTLILRDDNNNPVPNTVLTLSASGSNNSIVPNSGTTDANGTFVGAMTSTHAEIKTVLATFGSDSLNAAVTFVPGDPNSITTTLTSDTNAVAADGVTQANLLVSVYDAFLNPVPNVPVTLSATGSNVMLTPNGTSTDAGGRITATLSSNTVQASTVSALVGSASSFVETLTIQFTAGAPSTVTSTFSASPTSVVADGVSTSNLTLAVRDDSGNPVVGQSVTLSTNGTSSTLTPTSGTTDASGTFTATIASTRTQSEIITAQTGGITKTASVTFVAGAPSASTSTFLVNPNSLTADGTSSGTLTFSVADAQGNPVVGQAVTFASSGTNNTLSPSVTTTNASGIATATLRSTRAEAKTVAAQAGGVTLNAAITFLPGPISGSTSTLVINPNLRTADGSSSAAVTVTTLDAQGNPLNNETVMLSSTGTLNTLTPSSGATNSAGTFNATWTSTKAELKTLTATINSVVLTANANFVAGAPTSGNSNFTASPTTLTADGSATSTLRVTLIDAWGNPVSGQTVNLTSSGVGNSLTPSTGSTDASGNFSALLTSTHAEVKTVTATSGSLVQSAAVTFQAGSPNATMSTLTASPNAVAGDGSSTSTLTFTLLDSKGNPESGIPVSISATGTSNTLVPTSGTTNASGAFVATLRSTTVETKTVTATGASITKTTNVVFTPAVVSASTSSLSVSPTSLTADGTTNSTLTVSARNSSNGAVSGVAVTFTSTGSANTFTPVSGTTDSSGNFTATLSSTKAEAKTVTANVAGTNLTAAVTFVAGSPNTSASTLTVNPTSVIATGSATSAITFTLNDAQGNPVAGQTVSFASSGTSNALTPTSATTSAAGVATATLASTKAEVKTLTVTSGSISKTALITFTAGSASNPNTTFTASPTTNITADGSSVTTLAATVRDAFGNSVAGQSVSLTSTGSNNTFLPSPSGSTNASGAVTFTMSSTKAEAKTVTASIGGFTQTAAVTFVAGVPSNSSTISAPGSPVADNSTAEMVSVTVLDSQGNPVSGQSVSISSSGSGNTFSATSGTTNATGVWSTTLKSSKAETKTLTATIGSITATTTVTFVAGAASSSTTSLVVTPTTAIADNSNAVTCKVTVTDAQGNAVGSQSVSLTSSGSGNTFTPTSGTTNASGMFSATLVSTVAQTKTVTATIGGFTKTAAVTFVAGTVSGATSTLSASPTSLPADGLATTSLTVTARDAQSNLVNAQSVSMSSTGSSNTFTPTSGTTNTSGVFAATLKSTTQEAKIVTATLGTVNLTAAVTFTQATSALTVSGVPSPCNTAAYQPVVVKAVNSGGAVVAGYTGAVHFTSSDSAASLPVNYTFTSGDAGIHTFNNSLIFETVGTQSISATDTVFSSIAGSQTGIVVKDGVIALGVSRSTKVPANCAVFASGGLKCWGDNTYGNLGYGDVTNRGTTSAQMGSALPYINVGTSRTVVQAAVGGYLGGTHYYTCALLDNGTVKCWGGNDSSQLGYGDTVERHTPPSTAVNLGTGRTATQVIASGSSACALLDNATVSCWGGNGSGQVGVGDTVTHSTPRAVTQPSSHTVQRIAMGTNHVCALLDNKSIACWGWNSAGQLGVGDTNDRYTPTTTLSLGSGRSATDIAVGSVVSCALLDNQQLKCWGRNVDGELGLGNQTNQSSPPSATVSFGASRTVTFATPQGAVLDNQQLYTWGYNSPAVLGIGDTTNRSSPVGPIGFGSNFVTAIEINIEDHACALLNDGSVRCWGANASGQLGVGDTTTRGDGLSTLPASYPSVVF